MIARGSALPSLEAVQAERRRRADLKERQAIVRQEILAFHDDPAGFVRSCFLWRAGEHPRTYQTQALDRLIVKRRHAVRSPHGAGKTTVAAQAVIWFAITRDLAGEDWKVVTTASVWRQLEKFLWPEIHKWMRRVAWHKLGRDPWIRGREILDLQIKLPTGSAFAVASDDPAQIEGAHESQLLYVFDEAKAIQDRTWDAAEGAFSGPGYHLALAISTPGEPVGRFYAIQSRRPGFEDWDAQHVTVAEMIAEGVQTQAYVDQRKRQWGEESAVFQNRVLGEFAASEEAGVIPLAWVEAAVERWHAWREAVPPVLPITALGADVGRTGEDPSVVAIRSDMVLTEFRGPHNKRDTMEFAGMLAGLLQVNRGARAVVDVIGLGAGVVDRLRELGFEIRAFNAAARAMIGEQEAKDRTGELGFVNLRSAAWWTFRELLDPIYGPTLALPPHDDLIGELTAPHWRVVSGGKIEVEAKEKIRERIGRSTDYADAAIQAFADKFEEPESERVRLWGGVQVTR